MKESLKFKKGEEIPEPEGGWKVGMKARLESFATIRDNSANHRVRPGTLGVIKQIGGSVHDLLMQCRADDGAIVDVWLKFDEISPIKPIEEVEMERTNVWLSYKEDKPTKKENKEVAEEDYSHPKAA
ncbi:MAG: hypothetical protein UX07_C0043G0004 [Parcubacteria group bacterium GW2011_GWA2_45_30]|nr:MAG: hypothetical protein UX07_C0043G0004 [Parcubacteria group bacterium GW2011_GWA2_45_30]